jgi:cell wall-associated NlpC family hydrolase
MSLIDRRILPARGDVAAEHLRGRIEAERFTTGTVRRVIETSAPVRREPSQAASLDTEALFGETVTIYDEAEGWAWGQLGRDAYVGYMPANALAAPLAPTHRVSALRSFIYPAPSIKHPPSMALSFGSEIAAEGQQGLFVALRGGGFVFARHLAPLGEIESDPVAVAERFLGVPYLWGGKTSLGLDCSALVQTALQACGIACPRDSDQQEEALGETIPFDGDFADLRRGDLLFWRGHVALVRDPATMIHANGHAMAVSIEPLASGLARIEAAGDRLRRVKRLAYPRVAS